MHALIPVEILNNQKLIPIIEMCELGTFQRSCNTSESIFPGTFVANSLDMSSNITAISGVACKDDDQTQSRPGISIHEFKKDDHGFAMIVQIAKVVDEQRQDGFTKRRLFPLLKATATHLNLGPL